MLLTLDAVRGIDSTGVAAISKSNATTVAKAIGNPYELIGGRSFEKAMMGMNRAIIGHNRFATQGAVNKRNAHPFEFDTLVGVHNGTLTHKWQLEDSKDFVVDSENLYHHMDKMGVHDLLGVMQGAWSLVWWDKLDESINFLRNSERPMYICWDTGYTNLYWASEAWMLSVTLSRHGVKHTEIVQTDEDVHYSYHVNEELVVHQPVVKPMPSRAIKPVAYVKAETTVVSLPPQKKTETPTKTVSGISGYAGKTNMLLVILKEEVDRFGAVFYSCFDNEAPNENIRLYKGRGDSYSEGVEILCDISFVVYHEPPVNWMEEAWYSKVIHSSVITAYDDDEPIEDHDDQGNQYFNDPKGNKKIDVQWYTDHGTCAMCTGFVNPSMNFRFTKEGDSLCHECVADPETAKAVSYVN